MIGRVVRGLTQDRRVLGLTIVILLQILVGIFFFYDVIEEVLAGGKMDRLHLWFELLASLVLLSGVGFLVVQLRGLLNRLALLDRNMQAARGEMAEVIDAFFTEWSLTPSERDVALMVLKGIDNETIAEMRGTASGTVRAQCTSIYSKAGVDGRAQLFSVFMEELLASGE